MKKIISDIKELDIFIREFLSEIEQKNTAIIITLSGDLGAGKTALVKSAAQFLNISEEITSPTFVIQKEYKIENHNSFKKMIHIDAYRLENKHELEYLKWSENINNPENIIFMEWPEQVEGIDLPNLHPITINIIEDEKREITY